MGDTLEEQPTGGLLQDNFHLDSRLRPDNFQVLDEIDSRLQISLDPIGSRGPYSAGDKIIFKWQDHSALLDTTTSSFLIEVENTSATTSADPLQYKFSDGMNLLFNDVEILHGGQVIESTGREGSRLSQHLMLATSSQNHYDTECNALLKSYKYRSFLSKYEVSRALVGDAIVTGVDPTGTAGDRAVFKDKDLTWIKSEDGRKFQALVHLDHLSFFRNANFKAGFIEYEFKITLPDATKIMEKIDGLGAGEPSYKVNSMSFLADQIYPSSNILDSLHNSITNTEAGLTMILDDAVQVITQPLVNDVKNSFVLSVPLSNIQGIVGFIVDKSDHKDVDNVNSAPLPALKSYNIQVQNTELGVRNGVTGGLETAYAQYRKLYNMLTDVGGQGLMDFNRFKTHHTPLCLSTEILRDAPASVLRNSLETQSRSGQLQANFELENVDGDNSLANKQLLMYVFHKRIINVAESLVKVGK